MAPSAAIAPGGDALVGFAGSVAKDARVAVLDAHPPAITAMTVPATIGVGQPAAMTMSAADLWSGLAAGQPVWSFGDGTSAAGVIGRAHLRDGRHVHGDAHGRRQRGQPGDPGDPPDRRQRAVRPGR